MWWVADGPSRVLSWIHRKREGFHTCLSLDLHQRLSHHPLRSSRLAVTSWGNWARKIIGEIGKHADLAAVVSESSLTLPPNQAEGARMPFYMFLMRNPCSWRNEACFLPFPLHIPHQMRQEQAWLVVLYRGFISKGVQSSDMCYGRTQEPIRTYLGTKYSTWDLVTLVLHAKVSVWEGYPLYSHICLNRFTRA